MGTAFAAAGSPRACSSCGFAEMGWAQVAYSRGDCWVPGECADVVFVVQAIYLRGWRARHHALKPDVGTRPVATDSRVAGSVPPNSRRSPRRRARFTGAARRAARYKNFDFTCAANCSGVVVLLPIVHVSRVWGVLASALLVALGIRFIFLARPPLFANRK